MLIADRQSVRLWDAGKVSKRERRNRSVGRGFVCSVFYHRGERKLTVFMMILAIFYQSIPMPGEIVIGIAILTVIECAGSNHPSPTKAKTIDRSQIRYDDDATYQNRTINPAFRA